MAVPLAHAVPTAERKRRSSFHLDPVSEGLAAVPQAVGAAVALVASMVAPWDTEDKRWLQEPTKWEWKQLQ